MIICYTSLRHANENLESAYYKEYFTIKNDDKSMLEKHLNIYV